MPAAPSMTITTPGTAWARLDRELADFPKEHKQARYQAVKRTADQGRKMIFNRFKEQYPRVQQSKIESGDLTKRRRPIVSEVTKGANPVGTISVRDLKIPLIAFGPKGPGSKIPTLGRPGGVTVLMDKAKGPETFRHAFKAQMKSGHIGIFLRTLGKGRSVHARAGSSPFAARFPIRELYGPSIYDLVDVPAINKEVMAELDGMLILNIESQEKRFGLWQKWHPN
jgi:hypothetical protein